MERVLAGWFAEGTSYLSTMVWHKDAEGGVSKTAAGIEEANQQQQQRTRTEGSAASAVSAVSTASASSRTSVASSASARSGAKTVFGWLVTSSKKVLKGSSSSSSSSKHGGAAAGGDADRPAAKCTALDILMATNQQPENAVELGNLRALSVIGRGGYGKVVLMREGGSGRLVAVKEVAKSNLIDKKGSSRSSVRPVSTKIEHAEMESLVLHTVGQHPFVATFLGSYQTRDKLFMALDYVPGGELFAVMQRQGVFSEARTRLYVAEMTLALAFLHEHGIIYRDLKPENVLLDAAGHVRLADFGLSIKFQKNGDDNAMRAFSVCGTPEYIAPELILCATTKKNDKNASYGKTIDYWALATLMYEMLFRTPPFYSRDRKTMLNKILACDLQFPRTPPKTKPVSPAAKDFIAQLLKFEETDRLAYGNDGGAKVMAHPFFDGIDWDKLAAREVEPEFKPELKEAHDTSNFDATFTRELLRVDPGAPCPFNLELNGYAFLADTFDESRWYQKQPVLQQQQASPVAQVHQSTSTTPAAASSPVAPVVTSAVPIQPPSPGAVAEA